MPALPHAEALLRAAARRGWLEPRRVLELSEAIGPTDPAGLTDALRERKLGNLADRLPGLLPPPGAQYGRWTPLAHLGGGAMGSVWLAAEPGGPLVVVKTAGLPAPAPLAAASDSVWMGGGGRAKPKLRADPELERRFAREVEITAAMDHPAIVPCLGGGIASDGSRFLVLAWMPCGDLAERLRRQGRLPVVQAIAIAGQLAGALAHAHARGVVHRDLKPGNVFIDEQDQVRLGDFGLARPGSAAATRLTMTGVAVGTPTSMAPEQIDGSGRIDARTDLYGLGCLIFECIAGRPPFAGRSAEVMHAHRTTAPPDLATAGQTVPPDLARLVAALLAKNPADRPASAEAVQHTLEVIAGRLEAPPAPIPAAPVQPAGLRAAVLAQEGGTWAAVVWAGPRIVLGKQRGEGVDLVVRDYPEDEHRQRIARISRRHAAIAIEAAGPIVEDLSAANGTWLDGRRMRPGGREPIAGGVHRLGLAGAVELELHPLPGGVIIRRTANRTDLVYALLTGGIALGATPGLDVPGATVEVRLTGTGGALSADGVALSPGADLALGAVRLQVLPLGDWL